MLYEIFCIILGYVLGAIIVIAYSSWKEEYNYFKFFYYEVKDLMVG